MRRNGLGRARRIDVTQATPEIDTGPGVQARLLEAASVILIPPRRIAALTLGSSTLLARAVSLVLSEALDEGERQLAQVGTSLRAVAALWSD